MQSSQITSTDNPKFRSAAKLLAGGGRFLRERIAIFGVAETLRAVSAGAQLIEVFTCREVMTPEATTTLQRQLANRMLPTWDLSQRLFERLAYGDRSDGLLAIAQRPATDLQRIQLPSQALVVVLESVEKPGNVGAVARTADAVGASALLLASPRCDLFHSNCIRASLGSIFAVPTAAADAADVKHWLTQQNLAIVAARTDAERDYTTINLRESIAIVLGSESRGLSDIWKDPRIDAARLPMRGQADSLNVSVTAAVFLFEAIRQRGASSQR